MEETVIESINKVTRYCGMKGEDYEKYKKFCPMIPFPLKPVSRSKGFYANRNRNNKGKEIITF